MSPWLVLTVLLLADVPGRLARRFLPARDLLNSRLAIQMAMLAVTGIAVAILDRKNGSFGFMIIVGIGLMSFGLLYEWMSRKMDLARENDTWTKQLETRYSLSLLAGYVVFVGAFVGLVQVL